ncbi:hypothetical protein PanWU01x14_351970 [Parasponia andersonii]|uniref:Uncharacterized protein n=1 Tax=Parasponia andersonii TaxID=3476 RepID=A0A2P5AAG1_PARAD|nr:hypothetical protein PanWU01x14_351970 [Parasponia andersonii]
MFTIAPIEMRPSKRRTALTAPVRRCWILFYTARKRHRDIAPRQACIRAPSSNSRAHCSLSLSPVRRPQPPNSTKMNGFTDPLSSSTIVSCAVLNIICSAFHFTCSAIFSQTRPTKEMKPLSIVKLGKQEIRDGIKVEPQNDTVESAYSCRRRRKELEWALCLVLLKILLDTRVTKAPKKRLDGYTKALGIHDLPIMVPGTKALSRASW